MTIRSARLPMLMLVETLWGWALAAVAAQALSGDQGQGPSMLGVAAIVAGSAAVGALLRQFDVGEAQSRALGVASTLIGLAVIIPLEYRGDLVAFDERAGIIGAAVALGGIWIRGATRNDPDELFEPIARSAALGVVPVAIAAASQPAVHGPEMFGLVAILYVPLALLVLGLHHAAEPAKRVETLASNWAPFVLLAAVAAVVVTLLAAAIDPDAFGLLSPIGGPLRAGGDLLGRYVLGPIFGGLAWLFRLLPDWQRRDLQQMPPPDRPPPPEKEDPSGWDIAFTWLLRVFVPLAIVVAALIVIAMLFQYSRRRREPKEEDIVDRDDDDDDGGPGWLASLRSRFTRRGPTPSQIAIRRLYAEVLERAAVDGLERAPAATPLQFAPALDSRYGGAGTDITRAFIESRYGQRDISEDRVRELRARWEAGSAP